MVEFASGSQDTDICIEFLGLKMYRNPNHKYSVEALLKFLQINYSDKQILDFFSNIKKNDLYSSIIFGKLASNISRLDSLEDFFTEFKNTKCTLEDLHNAVVDCLRRSNEKQIRGVKIEILPSHLEPCGKMDDYEVKIIQSGDELIDWSDYLKNDIFLDLYAIINHKTQIYGFFKDSNLKFIVRINNAYNITSRAFNNDQLKTEEEELKDKWICQFFAPKKDSDRIPLEIIY